MMAEPDLRPLAAVRSDARNVHGLVEPHCIHGMLQGRWADELRTSHRSRNEGEEGREGEAVSRILTMEEVEKWLTSGLKHEISLDLVDSHEALRAERDEAKRDYAAVAEAVGVFYGEGYPGPVDVVLQQIREWRQQECMLADVRAERDAAIERARIADNVVCWAVECVHQAMVEAELAHAHGKARDIVQQSMGIGKERDAFRERAEKAEAERDAANERAEKAEADRDAMRVRMNMEIEQYGNALRIVDEVIAERDELRGKLAAVVDILESADDQLSACRKCNAYVVKDEIRQALKGNVAKCAP